MTGFFAGALTSQLVNLPTFPKAALTGIVSFAVIMILFVVLPKPDGTSH